MGGKWISFLALEIDKRFAPQKAPHLSLGIIPFVPFNLDSSEISVWN